MTQTSTGPAMQSPPTGAPATESTSPPGGAQEWMQAQMRRTMELSDPTYGDRLVADEFSDQLGQLDRISERHEERAASLLTPEGRRLYSDEEHQKRAASFLAEAEGQIQKVESAADAALKRAEQTITLAAPTPATHSRRASWPKRRAASPSLMRTWRASAGTTSTPASRRCSRAGASRSATSTPGRSSSGSPG